MEGIGFPDPSVFENAEYLEAWEHLSTEEKENVVMMHHVMRMYADGGAAEKFVVDSVQVEGLGRTQSWIVADAVADLSTMAASLEEIVQGAQIAKAELMNLNIFKDVSIVLDSSDVSADGIDVKFVVEENSLCYTDVGTSVGQDSADCTLGVRIGNPMGVADHFDIKGKRVFPGLTVYDASYTVPVGGDVHFPLSCHLFKSHQQFKESSHEQISQGCAVEYQTWSVLGRHTLRYDASWRNLTAIADKASFDVRWDAGHSLKSALKHTLLVDNLDDDLKSGSTFVVQNELAGVRLGGDAHFLKTVVEAEFRRPAWFGCELRLGLRGGLMHNLNRMATTGLVRPRAPGAGTTLESENRINDRLFLGGSGDVRGFEYRGVGPHDQSDALGGDAYWASGLHLYTPLPYKPWRDRVGDMIRLHFFTNAGSVAVVNSQSTLSQAAQSLSDVRASAGFGISWQALSGWFTFELNYCVPLKRGPGDRTKQGLQLGVGVRFL